MDKFKPKVEKEVYELEDDAFLLITALNNLADKIDALRVSMK